MKLLFAGYRSWAHAAYTELQRLRGVDIELVESPKALDAALREEAWDVVALVGWSWIVPAQHTVDHYVVVVHPSDLPAYAGGSPLQHQIIDGVTETQATLFRAATQLDGGAVLYKCPLSLEGHLDDVFARLTYVTCDLLGQLIRDWPTVAEHPQVGYVAPRKRLQPKDGELTHDRLQHLTCQQLYDFIRCREHPYPSAFIKDETGTLYIERVRFKRG